MKRLLIVLLMTGLFSCDSPSVEGDRPTYRIGYMVCNSKEETLQRFRPLTAYLSKKMGVDFETVAIDTVDFSREVDNLHFTHSNSLLYIILNRNHGVEILAGEKAGSLGAHSQGAIVARRESGIKTLEDLRNRTMIFGPMFAPTGYLSQMDLLISAGLTPEDDLSFYSIPTGSFKHEKVIYGVLFGKYDAGAFPMLDFERMIDSGKIDAEDFTVVAKATPIPYCNFGSTQKVEDSFAKKFKKVLLGIDKDDTVELDGEVVRIFSEASIDGYEDINDEDFDILREMAKRTNMPPYQRY